MSPHPQHNTNTQSVVRLGLIQRACVCDPVQNEDQTIQMIREAARQGAQIIATQELFTTRYFPQTEDVRAFELAQPIPGPTSDRLGRLASELGVRIIASIFEQRAPGLYHNTAITFDVDGRLINSYRKMHIPDDPGFYEKYYFTPGDACSPDPAYSPWAAVDAPPARTGVLICWDQWFPEAARLACLHGAQALFYPTAIGWHRDEPAAERTRQLDAWQTVQRAHAIANGVFVAAINRVGIESDLEFWGNSFVADPGGQVIAQASGDQPEILIADCDLRAIDTTRQHWPFLRDRRIDAYRGLLHRYQD